MSSITPTRTLSINACVPPSTRPSAKTSQQSPSAIISLVSTDLSLEPSPLDSPLTRPSFSAFDKIYPETPQELKPLGLGLTRTATSETFRENFNRYNNIPPGGGLGNLGNMSRSNSSSSNSSRTSTRSAASSMSSADFPEKLPVYILPKVEEKVVEEKEKGGLWSPLMWLKWLFILRLPTFTLTWIVSLIYFTLMPHLFDSQGKVLDDWIFQTMLQDNPTARQEGIDGEGYRKARSKMRKWEVVTVGSTGLLWTTLCIVFDILAVDASISGH